jgi:solute carrier family 25 oxoglutarate transporter 11
MANLVILQPFVVGMLAGVIATLVVQPIDFLKLRKQLVGEGVKSVARQSTLQFVSRQGIGVLYTGIGAALARQIVYGSSRLGLFRIFSDGLKTDNLALPVWTKIGVALAAGAVAALLGNPCDLALVRMQSDSSLPLEQRRYRGIFDAVRRIIEEEGVFALWRGSTPTLLRAMAVNAGMLATADQSKEYLASLMGESSENSLAVLLLSSLIAGITASVVSLPFDAVKTRECQEN